MSNIRNMTSQLNSIVGFDTFLFHSSLQHCMATLHSFMNYFWCCSIIQIYFGIPTVNNLLIWFEILNAIDNWYHTIYNIIVVNSENKLVLFHDGYGNKTLLFTILLVRSSSWRKLCYWGYDSKLCMFSYCQTQPTSNIKTNGAPLSKDRVTADVKTNTKFLKSLFTSSFLSGIKTFRKAWSKTLPNGFISLFLVLLMTIGLLTILTGIKCHHILNSRNSTLSLTSKGATAMGISTTSGWVVDRISLSCEGVNELGISKHTLYSMEDFEQDIKHPLCLL